MNGKTRADLVLIIVFLTFLAVTALEFMVGRSPGLDFLRFGLEGALVGGMADWFAVTALFRKPLGFGWHTALIPQNRKKFISALQKLVEEDLLSVETLGQKLPGLHLPQRLLGWISRPASAPVIQSNLQIIAGSFARTIEPRQVAVKLEELVRSRLEGVPGEAYSRTLLESQLMDVSQKNRIWESVARIADQPETTAAIEALLSSQQARIPGFLQVLLTKSDTLDLEDAAVCLQDELVSLLKQVASEPDDPLRLQVEGWLTSLVHELTGQGVWKAALVDWQTDLIAQTDLAAFFERILNSLLHQDKLEAFVADQFYPQVVQLADRLARDDAMVQWLEEQVNSLLSQLISSQHYVIGELVRSSLEALTDEKLNLLVQSRVGQDLQWIRINGSMLGGALGLLAYLLLYGLYLPLLPS